MSHSSPALHASCIQSEPAVQYQCHVDPVNLITWLRFHIITHQRCMVMHYETRWCTFTRVVYLYMVSHVIYSPVSVKAGHGIERESQKHNITFYQLLNYYKTTTGRKFTVFLSFDLLRLTLLLYCSLASVMSLLTFSSTVNTSSSGSGRSRTTSVPCTQHSDVNTQPRTHTHPYPFLPSIFHWRPSLFGPCSNTMTPRPWRRRGRAIV